MEKYLFLDFDGVLNTTGYAKRLKKEGLLRMIHRPKPSTTE